MWITCETGNPGAFAPTAPPTPAEAPDFLVEGLVEFCRREVKFQRLERSESEDVVQDALVSWVLHRAAVVNPLAYLKVVVRRQAAAVRRSRRTSLRLHEEASIDLQVGHDPWSSVDSRLDSSRALRALLPADRRLLLLVSDGHSFHEIGAALGCSPGAARVRVFRARRKIAPAE